MLPITHSRVARRAAVTSLAAAAALSLVLSGCSAQEGEADASAKAEVTLIVHDSFPNKDFAKAASAATGYDVKVVAAGDGGELTNKLVLTKGAPVADAFFGVDTIFASRLVTNNVVEKYAPAKLPDGAADYAVKDEASAASGDQEVIKNTGLVPVDFGSTCVNIDTGWFAERGIAEPQSYEDLADPTYKDLTALLDPTASSTGASFLVGTVAKFGENSFADYWKKLVDNGARIEQGWSDAYYGQFTQGGEQGTKPIVVSYASSPAFTVNDAGTASSTKALLDTCTRQVEYAGVLAGAKNSKGAKAVVDYLVSQEFQQTIPDAMYMNPVDASVKVPDAWAKFAPEPINGQTNDLPSSTIESGREVWLKTLGEKISL